MGFISSLAKFLCLDLDTDVVISITCWR